MRFAVDEGNEVTDARLVDSAKPLVLVIDDDVSIVRVLYEALTAEGYDVAIATDGELGLQRLRERRPAVIILDVMMPVVDGVQFRTRQLGDPALRDVPVIVCTSKPSAAPEMVVGPLRAAATVRKPFDLDHLLAVIASCVRGSAGDAQTSSSEGA